MENVKNNKRILLGVIGAFILVGIVVFGISYALTGDDNFLKNQKVDGLSFENAKVEYKDGTSTFTVVVYNENNDTYNVESIDIDLKGKNKETVSMNADLGGSLESDEGRLITVTTDKNITDMVSLEYKINK